MSYELCLFFAGAKVIAFGSFGDWQGSWYAKVEYAGEVGWVCGSYGSCSGCDAFEAEFYDAYSDAPDLNSRYAEFGKSYLESIISQEQQESILQISREEPEILDFVKAQR